MSNPGNNPQDYELFKKLIDGDGSVSDSDKPKQDASVHSWIPPPPTGSAAEIFPLLKGLLRQNEIQRERLSELVELYDPTGEYRVAEAQQIAANEARLSALVGFWKERVQELEQELENQKKAYAELEDEIKRLMRSSNAENHD